MAPHFPFGSSVLPALQTRKALLIFDLQNDFVSDDALLPLTGPEGVMDRILAFAKSFRDSGAGDVIWVRSEFESHRPLTVDGDQIVTAQIRIPPPRPGRGRQRESRNTDAASLEADEEAFLSVMAESDKPSCVRTGTPGADFPPNVQEAIVDGRDIVFTKTHYSAFASEQQQLIQMLRMRFVTELFVCGALTNVSIYATALDAGRHGYEMTVVEDCCGFRDEMRHMNALRQLMQLTGCEIQSHEAVMDDLAPPPPPKKKESIKPPPAATRGSGREAADGSGTSQESPVRLPTPQGPSTGLSPSISRITLSLDGELAGDNSTSRRDSAGSSDGAQPQQQAPLQQQQQQHDKREAVEAEPTVQPVVAAKDKDTSQEEEEAAANQSTEETLKGPPRTLVRRPLAAPPSPSSSAKVPEPSRIRVKPKRRHRPPTSEEQKSSAPPPQTQPPSTSPAKKTAGPAPPKKADEPNPLKSEPIVAPDPKPTSTKMTDKPVTTTPEKAKVDTDNAAATTFSGPLCEGDTTIIGNVLPPALAANAFERLLDEVSWAGMSRLGGEVPRRVAVQGEIDEEGNLPVYRHPTDESPPLLPFSPTVLEIKRDIEKHLGHPLNHVLIQHYRNGSDYISEHSDKTLDVMRDSFIANVSLGAERTMVFRTKRPEKDPSKTAAAGSDEESPQDVRSQETPAEKAQRQVQRAPLPHNSLCRMGLATNMRWLHAIRQDKRSDKEKSAAEMACSGARISLTFRRIGTFLDASQTLIWGQGATGKTRAEAKQVINGQTPDAVRMLQAFGSENHSSNFDWTAKYGQGFDVLHMGAPKRFCAGSDLIANMRVALALAELGIGAAKGSVEGDVRFEDNDPGRAVVDGHDSVLRYLDAVYCAGRRYDQLPAADVARRFTRLQLALDLLPRWRRWLDLVLQDTVDDDEHSERNATKLTRLRSVVRKDMLPEWERYAAESAKKNAAAGGMFYIAGGRSAPSPADFALWPVLHNIVRLTGGDDVVLEVGSSQPDEGHYLARYYRIFRERSAVAKVLGPPNKSPVKEAEKAVKPEPETEVLAVRSSDSGESESGSGSGRGQGRRRRP
ncbi:hypothetical protein B0H63DRAFT_427314 [Podospora didyma]|uniref:Fe2OG dioxygenase domain-containing protein n=1 Tax=Podospora didyma TaxID=330526 RepID=A0AAE0P8B6_9PEZI|nr:hypothetical protein B0H63DRAFT_427314 [Podospora didyma]